MNSVLLRNSPATWTEHTDDADDSEKHRSGFSRQTAKKINAADLQSSGTFVIYQLDGRSGLLAASDTNPQTPAFPDHVNAIHR